MLSRPAGEGCAGACSASASEEMGGACFCVLRLKPTPMRIAPALVNQRVNLRKEERGVRAADRRSSPGSIGGGPRRLYCQALKPWHRKHIMRSQRIVVITRGGQADTNFKLGDIDVLFIQGCHISLVAQSYIGRGACVSTTERNNATLWSCFARRKVIGRNWKLAARRRPWSSRVSTQGRFSVRQSPPPHCLEAREAFRTRSRMSSRP